MTILLPSLFDHQEDHKQRVRASLVKHRRVIMCAEPGFGKTRVAKNILGASANKPKGTGQSGYTLFAVFRRGLVDNAIESFAEDPQLPHGIIMSGRETAYGYRTQVASIDTLNSWFCEGGKYTSKLTFDMIVFDETDNHFPKLRTFLASHEEQRESLGLNKTFVLGLTATPQAKGLGDVYKEIVTGQSASWLIANKYLSPFRYFRADHEGQLGLLVKKGQKFTDESSDAAMKQLNGADLVSDWRKFAEGRPTVGFFVRLVYAKDAQSRLQAEGIRAEYVDGKTPDDERVSLFRALNNGSIDYLCNVGIVDRGTNIPAISCVQVCTPICSIKRWRQMITRGSRTHNGKTECVILDHAGNIKRLNHFVEDDPEWVLDVTTDKTTEAATRPVIECPRCRANYRGGKCSNCGYEPSKSERKAQGLEFDGTELQEVKPKKKTASDKKQTNEQILVSTLYRCGNSGRTWKQVYRIACDTAEKQGTRFQCPRRFNVGEHTYEAASKDDQSRRIANLYPFTVGQHGGEYLVRSEKREDVLF